MSNNIARIVKSNVDGVEVYVETSTGKAGLSGNALARMSGKPETNVRRLIDSVRRNNAPKRLERFQGMDLAFATADGSLQNAKVYRSDFCAAVIAYYASLPGTDNEVAQYSLDKIATSGLDKWAQDTVGWKPPIVGELTSEQIVNMLILPEAKEWTLRFPPEYYAQLERLTGLTAGKHGRPPLWGKLTREWVYDYLPAGVYERLCDLRDNHSKRPRLHQFLVEETGIELLRDHYNALMVLMQAADSMFEVSKLLRTRKDVTTRILEARQFTNALPQASN